MAKLTATKERFFNFETEAEEMVIRLSVQAESLGRYLDGEIKQMFLRGMSEDEIVATLTRDLADNGRLTSPLRQGFKSTVNTAIEDIAQGAVFEKYPETAQWEWIVTSSNPCRDCLPRHGETATYDEWRELGLPRSGFSVCRENCQCVLLPKGKHTPDLDEPVTVKTLPEYRQDFQEKLAQDKGLQEEIEAYRVLQREKARARRQAARTNR